jgi:hypothetical protein
MSGKQAQEQTFSQFAFGPREQGIVYAVVLSPPAGEERDSGEGAMGGGVNDRCQSISIGPKKYGSRSSPPHPQRREETGLR